ncbi:MAG: ComEC/Rec2 family competence protein, partial [Terracidiphilus sp.]
MQSNSPNFEQLAEGPITSVAPGAAPAPVPLFHAAWLFAGGIAATKALYLPPSLVLVALALVAVLCGVAAFRAQRIAWLPLAVLWLLLGAWCAEMEPQPAPAPALAALSNGLARDVEGTVVDAGPMRGEIEQSLIDQDDHGEPADPAERPTQRIDLSVSSLEIVTDTNDAQTPVNGRVRLTIHWPQGLADQQPFQCGDRVRATAQLRFPENYRDPGVWSREDFLVDQGITSAAPVSIDRVMRIGKAGAPNDKSSSLGWKTPGLLLACRLSSLQRASSARLLALPASMRRLPAPLRLSEDDAVMLAAMVTGDRTFLTHSLRVGFERTGSFHMLVVSGFHLAIVAGCIFWVAKQLRLPRVPATLLTILASFAYALFTGFATPVERSLWMVTLYLLGRLLYRERNALNTIGFAALCLLAFSPRSLFDASFQMTLLAVVAIGGVAAPLLQGTIHPYLTATRALDTIALDIKQPPHLAQFRVMLRMVAAAFHSDFHSRRAASREPIPTESVAEGQPPLALIPAAPSTEVLQEAASQKLVARMAWRGFLFTLRFILRAFELVAVSCVAELAMALPMALYFHRITVFALPVNIFILPLLLVLMPAALVTFLALLIWPPAAVVPAMAVALPLHFGIWLVRVFGSMAWGDLRIPAPLLWQSLAFCALLAVAVVLARLANSPGIRWPRRAVLASLLALLIAAFIAVMPRPIDHPRDALLMEAIDVGQGDSLLLITPDGKTLLVDGGGHGGGPRQAPQDFDIGEEIVS